MEYCRIAKSPEWCKLGAYTRTTSFCSFAVQFGLLGTHGPVAWLVTARAGHSAATTAEKMLGFALLATLVVRTRCSIRRCTS